MKIIGHQKQIDMLNSAIEKNRVHSAYLFVGQAGIGKKQVALEFAQMLNCQNPQDLKKPCGECLPCRKIEKFTHPDVITITVQEEKTSIAIEQIREMIKGLQFSAVMGGYNIRIIDDAHLMRSEAANSLLKILEEPPENVVIVLITPVPKSLPSTIISRCAVIYFGILSDEEIKNEIRKYNLPSDEVEFINSIAAGSLGCAIELAKNRENISDYKNIISDFQNGKFSNKKFKERKEAVDLLNMLVARVRVEKPEKLEDVLKMKNYITRNTNIWLTFEVLKNNLKQG
ncbi:MAG: AAA family ATPase [Elusimicrobia bacterium]|nr:AAA family ATPase [Elusimicrobiota bacterium]